MWSITLLLPSLPSVAYSLSWVGLVLLLAGSLFVTYGSWMMSSRKLETEMRRRIAEWKAMNANSGTAELQYAPSKSIPSAQRHASLIKIGVVGLVCFVAGYWTRDVQTDRRLDSYRMHVIEHSGPYQYVVERQGQRFLFNVCHNIDDPLFEAGETTDVTFEERSVCKDFGDLDRTGWKTVRDEHGNIIKTGGE